MEGIFDEIITEDDILLSLDTYEGIPESASIVYIASGPYVPFSLWSTVKHIIKKMFSVIIIDEVTPFIQTGTSTVWRVAFTKKVRMIDLCIFRKRLIMLAENNSSLAWVTIIEPHLYTEIIIEFNPLKQCPSIIKDTKNESRIILNCFIEGYFLSDLFIGSDIYIINHLLSFEKNVKKIEFYYDRYIKYNGRIRKNEYQAFILTADNYCTEIKLSTSEKKLLRRQLFSNMFSKSLGIFKYPKPIWRNSLPYRCILLVKISNK